MKLSAAHPIDAIELQWAQELRSSKFGLLKLAEVSGRDEAEWAAAFAARTAPFPSNFTIHERFAVVNHALVTGLTIAATSMLARAPRAWCAATMQRRFEIDRHDDWMTPELTGQRVLRLAAPSHTPPSGDQRHG
ncbi:MAG: hypothetical protein DCF29_09465 [Alphaproteobacteria bacterium]|nr:MAG: hypothetical protein DCF29_09465 [Alphaproteobacteria bacterium]